MAFYAHRDNRRDRLCGHSQNEGSLRARSRALWRWRGAGIGSSEDEAVLGETMPDTSDDATILVERPAEQIRLIRLNRPERLNALTREMVRDFNFILDEIAADPSCRAVIVTGAGRGFCSGQDVAAADARNRAHPSGIVERLFWQEQFSGMGQRMNAMPQIVIAAVNGPAVGAGMAIALAADVRIAGRSARFLNAAVRLGLTAGESGMSYFLPRLIGAARAFDIMLTGRPVEADEAERIGLCARLVDDGTVVEEAIGFAATVLANSPFAVAHTKRVMWQNLDAPSYAAALELENRAQILASMTEDYKEATAAFSEKRVPKFQGK
jgi:enoyl-CoA hydratase